MYFCWKQVIAKIPKKLPPRFTGSLVVYSPTFPLIPFLTGWIPFLDPAALFLTVCIYERENEVEELIVILWMLSLFFLCRPAAGGLVGVNEWLSPSFDTPVQRNTDHVFYHF